MKHTPVSDYTHPVKPLSPQSEHPTSSNTPHTTTLLTIADAKPLQTQREDCQYRNNHGKAFHRFNRLQFESDDPPPSTGMLALILLRPTQARNSGRAEQCRYVR